MKQQLVELERIHFTRVFAWMHLFRAFRIALDIRKMLLGAAALLILGAGLYLISYLPLDIEESQIERLRRPPWNQPLAEGEPPAMVRDLSWAAIGDLLARPITSLVQPFVSLIHRPLTWTGAALGWTQILWTLVVWSFFGTAISRMAAVQFAVDERVSLKEALTFAGSKFLWAISAPLMPLAGLLLLWFFCVVGGWIGLIPAAGAILVGLFWIIPLLLALVMLLLLVGLLFGWPLMIATISTQGSDAYDGFSRSFDYVYSRFWHLAWFLIVAAVYGVVMFLVVAGAALLIADLAAMAVRMGMGEDFPQLLGGNWPAFFAVGERAAEPATFASRCVSAWLYGLLLLVAGYAVSYFWSAATIIYFLLRQSEDANHLSEVYLPPTDKPDELVQLAGVAASEQPIIERPAKHESEASQEPQPDPNTAEADKPPTEPE